MAGLYGHVSRTAGRLPGRNANGNEAANAPRQEVDMFIRDRQTSMRKSKKADVDRMTRAALDRVDKEQTLREAHALRERMKERPAPRVRHRSQRDG